MSDRVAELLAPLLRAPDRAGVATDFDGTLAQIVPDPDAARPLPGAVEALDRLAQRYRLAAVVSGRPVEFLQRHLPSSLVLAGQYGLEVIERGRRADHEAATAWEPVIAEVATASESAGPAGMQVERKRRSLTLHFRRQPDIEPAVRAWAEQQGARSGLEVRTAKMSYELHPPIGVDKGTTLFGLAQGLEAVCFLGDDRGDLAAFDALDRLAEAGTHAVRVAVHSHEAPVALLERADLVVDGPPGVLEVLQVLAFSA